jgi:hypothetical protein
MGGLEFTSKVNLRGIEYFVKKSYVKMVGNMKHLEVKVNFN